jgi:hypothetical protein
MTPQLELILTAVGIIVGLTYCAVRVVGDLRKRRQLPAALGIVTALVLLHMARLVYLLAGL